MHIALVWSSLRIFHAAVEETFRKTAICLCDTVWCTGLYMEVFVQLIFILFERVTSQLSTTSPSDETWEVFKGNTAAVKHSKDASHRQNVSSHPKALEYH